MTLKDDIYESLVTLDIPVAYNDTDISELPRINFTLISNYAIKFSNNRHRQVLRYQIDVFSDVPLNVEDDTLLLGVESALANKRIRCTPWTEVSNIDAEVDLGIYRYYAEAWR